MTTPTPRVSIGLPVYNGEAFLAEALDSLLAQTYRDFEIVISDNASTDATESICRERAARDARVRYVRSETNVGAMRNFNRVFELSRGEYFKWAAHDDVHDPEYLERCVAVLDAERDVVLVHTAYREVDEAGRTIQTRRDGRLTADDSVGRRFRALSDRRHSCQIIFGLMRASTLRRTRLLANYADCDRVLLAEIGLAGKMREIPDVLFAHREHRDRSVRQYRSRQTRNVWFDPARAGRPAMPYTRQFGEYMKAIGRAPISAGDRAACRLVMCTWLFRNADGLWEDVSYAVRFALRPIKRRVFPPSDRVGSGAGGRPQ